MKFTCRFWWQTGGCFSRTHLPKRCRHTWSVGEQDWGQAGGLRTRQLEQVVCWQWPPHSRFSSDTDLQPRTGRSSETLNRWIKTSSRSYLAEHISLRFALQNSHVHSGLQASALRTSSTVWNDKSKINKKAQSLNPLWNNVLQVKEKTDNKTDGIPLQYGCSSSGKLVDFITV